MGFFERAHLAKTKTSQLIVMFTLIYLLTAVIGGSTLSFLLSQLYGSNDFLIDMFWIGGTSIVFMLTMTLVRKKELSVGADYVLTQLKAVQVNEFHKNPIVRRYYNIASEMAISAGIKLPRIYLLPSSEINALAVASNDEDVSIAITEGALTRLSRQELQGIIAHEMSHILHKDCILNFKLVSWLFGLQCVYLYGRDIFKTITGIYPRRLDMICVGYTNRFEYERTPFVLGMILAIYALFIMMLGFIGAVGARIIKAMISREREYLADAEAVRMTRSRELANVLKKIAFIESEEIDIDTARLRESSVYQEFSHFYLNDYEPEEGLFDSHPPILKRIKAIDPHFKIPTIDELAKMNATLYDGMNEDQELQHELARYASNKLTGSVSHDYVSTLGIKNSNEHLSYNIAYCYAILLSSTRPDILKKQYDYLKKSVSDTIYDQVKMSFANLKNTLDDKEKINFLITSIPDFDSIDEHDLQSFKKAMKALIVMDSELSIFEYCVWKILESFSTKASSHEKGGLVFDKANRPIVEMSDEIAAFINIVLNEALVNKMIAKQHYDEVIEQFGAQVPFKEEIAWFKVLEDILPILKNLTPAGSDYLADVLNDFYNLPASRVNGKNLIHALCLVLNIRTPDVLRYKEGDATEKVQRINIYG